MTHSGSFSTKEPREGVHGPWEGVRSPPARCPEPTPASVRLLLPPQACVLKESGIHVHFWFLTSRVLEAGGSHGYRC